MRSLFSAHLELVHCIELACATHLSRPQIENNKHRQIIFKINAESQLANHTWLPTFGICLAGTRSLGGFVTKVSTSPALVATLPMCLARTRTYKRVRDESFHLTGFAGQKHINTNLAIMMRKMSVDASFVTDSLSHRSLASTCRHAHSSNANSNNISRPQMGKVTNCKSANASVKQINSQNDKCQSTIANVLLILLCASSK